MPDISKDELWRQLKSGVVSPVYVLFGPETFLRDKAAREIVRRSFNEGDLRDFNYDEFSLNEREGIAAAIAAAEQLPMMSGKRVVKVRNVRIAASTLRDTVLESDEEILGRYLADPLSSTILILIAEELNGTRKLTKLLKKHAVTVEFKILDGPALSGWINKTVLDLGMRIDESASRRLIERVGPNLQRLSNELEKVSAAAFPSKAITVELVDELVVPSRELENFALTDALVSGQSARVLEVLKRILDGGSEPVALLGLLSFNIRRLSMTKEMMARGDDRAPVAEVLRMRTLDQQDFLAAARRVDRSQLLHFFDRLKEVDLAMKTSVGGGGKEGSRLQLEVLVCEMITAMRRPRPNQHREPS
jgi:DNA polymerase-3 subunit delta